MNLDFNLENKITNKRKAFGEYILRCFFVTRNGGGRMREITVNYLILDEEEDRLKKITEEYKKQGLNLSEDKMFEGIMCCGSKYDVDSKLKFYEWKLGLREDYK